MQLPVVSIFEYNLKLRKDFANRIHTFKSHRL